MHFSSSASAYSSACSALILPGPISNSLPLNSKNPPSCLAQSSMLSRVLQFLHLEHLPRLSVPHALYRGIRPFHDHFSRRAESWRPQCPAGFAFLFPAASFVRTIFSGFVLRRWTAIRRIGRNPSTPSVMQFNAAILGPHNRCEVAACVYIDFDRIAFDVRKSLLCKTKSYRSETGLGSQAFQQFYGDFHGKSFYVAKPALFPINGATTKPPLCFSQDICSHTDPCVAK